MGEREPSQRGAVGSPGGLPGEEPHDADAIRAATRSFAGKLQALNDSLAADPDTVGEVRKQLNTLFGLLRTEQLSSLSGRAVSDVAERLAMGWTSLGERYREARRALQLYEGIAAPLAKVLEAEAEILEADAKDRAFDEHTRALERGMALRAAALETSERFYETLVPLLGGP